MYRIDINCPTCDMVYEFEVGYHNNRYYIDMERKNCSCAIEEEERELIREKAINERKISTFR